MRSFKTLFALALCLTYGTLAFGQLGVQLDKLIPTDGSANDQFGSFVSQHGSTALVGARDDDANGNLSGSAYLMDTTTGTQLHKLTPNDGSAIDQFGVSGDLVGSTAIVGSWLDDGKGSAYLFDAATGAQTLKLTAPDGTPGDSFGFSTSLDVPFDFPLNPKALVGAWGDDDNGNQSGSAYLFNGADGTLLNKLTAPDGAAGDLFGMSVDLMFDTALVSAHGQQNNMGAAYLFDASSGALLQKFTAPDGSAEDNFGQSVATFAGVSLVGAPGDDDQGTSSGSAYLFDHTTGNLLHKLTPDDGSANALFGSSVALDGGTALIGSWGDNGSGSAYLFDINTGTQLAKLTPSDVAPNDFSGYSVDLAFGQAIIGSTGDDDNGPRSGAAYLFTASEILQLVQALAGDANGDGMVGIADLNVLGKNFGMTSGASYSLGDFDFDGSIGLGDLNILSGNWSFDSTPSTPTAIPEPATVLLMALGLLALANRRDQ